MDIALTVAGTLVILVVLQDVFTTVLVPSSGHGIVRTRISSAVWVLFRSFARRCAPGRGRAVLGYAGPVVMTVNLATWVLGLIAGFALLYQPALGAGVQAASGATDTSWATALYYSGYTASTLGLGDVVAVHGAYRLLTITQSTLGFAGITMAITYFLSVYSNLSKRNAGAEGLHHRTLGGGDAVELVASVAGASADQGASQLSETAGYLRQVTQAHTFFPVLRYFHYGTTSLALPRVLLLAFDGAALVRTAVDPDRHADVVGARSIDELEQAAASLLDVLSGEDHGASGAEDARSWRSRHDRACEQLRGRGVAVAPDPDRYAQLRQGWDGRLRALTDAMGYDWNDIDPAGVAAAA